MTRDREQLERELAQHMSETAGAPRSDAAARLRARVAATPQRQGWFVRLATATGPGWTRAGALVAVAAAALVVGIYIGQVGLPIQVGPSTSPSVSTTADVSPTESGRPSPSVQASPVPGGVAMSYAEWHRVDIPDPAPGVFGGGTPSSVVAFDGSYIAVGTIFTECCAEADPAANVGVVWMSSNGAVWELVETGDAFEHASLGQVVVIGSRLLASGSVATPGTEPAPERSVAAAWVSDDGVSWRRIPDPAPAWVVVTDDILLGAAQPTGNSGSVSFLRSNDGLTWRATDVQPDLDRVEAATAAPGGGALFVGSVEGRQRADGTPTFDVQVWLTPDGVTWSGAIAAENAHVAAVAAWKDRFVAAGYRPGIVEGSAVDIGTVWTSADGLSWRAVGSIGGMEDGNLRGVVALGEALVATADCCGGDLPIRPIAWVTEDGATWTSVPHQPAFDGMDIQIADVIETPDGLLAVGRRWDPESNHPVPQAWLSSSVPMVWLHATSEPGAQIGTRYDFQFGHCGLQSPIDFDGSLWVMSGSDYVTPPVPLDMLVGTIRLTDPDSAVFESESSSWSMPFSRHDGPLAYPLCD